MVLLPEIVKKYDLPFSDFNALSIISPIFSRRVFLLLLKTASV
jgi:hypothetical protein